MDSTDQQICFQPFIFCYVDVPFITFAFYSELSEITNSIFDVKTLCFFFFNLFNLFLFISSTVLFLWKKLEI